MTNRREDAFDASVEDQTAARGSRDGLGRILAILRRRWLLIAIPMIVGATVAYVASNAEPAEYESSASLLFRDRNLAQIFDESLPSGYVDPVRQAATNVDLVSSEEVAQRVATRLGIPGPISELTDNVSISQGDSDLVRITARYEDPAVAANVANTWAGEYIEFRREADRAQIVDTIRLIDQRLASLSESAAQGAAGQTLLSGRSRLEIIASLQTGNAELVEPARASTSPVSPLPRRSAALGGVLGLLFGLALAFVTERLDRRVRDVDQLEALLKIPILGTIPRSKRLVYRRKAEGATGRTELLSRDEREAFRVLRTNIMFSAVDRELDSLLITSAVPGEGKTTVALDLAQAFADFGARTLLLEGDLRRPVMAERLGITDPRGITNVLVTGIDPVAVTHTISEADEPGHIGRLDVILSGPRPPNPQAILETKSMEELVGRLRQRYDFVIIDGPPMLGLGDVASLARHVSEILIVSRLQTTTVESAEKLRARLRLVGIHPLGIVVNGADLDTAYGDYGEPEVLFDPNQPTGDRARAN